jgi:hypothetical protein
VRSVAVAALLGGVLGASALDLSLGVLWIVSLAGTLLLRRRLRLAAPLVLLASMGVTIVGARLGWFPSPSPASYEGGWVPGGGAPPPTSAPAGDLRIDVARDRLHALGREELRLTGSELEQRAGALIALARRLDPLRGDAPREVAAVEGAARRLARTLAAPEFRDLETRRAAAAAHLADLDRRLVTAREAGEAAVVLRAVDPAAMAHLSLRPVHEDLNHAAAAVEALVRLLGGGVPSAMAKATARYDESRSEVRWEVRYTVTGAPGVRLLRIETRAFRGVAPAGTHLSLAYATSGEAPRPVPPGVWMDLEPAPRGAAVIAAWTEPATTRVVRAMLRPIAFGRLEVDAPTMSDDALIVAVLDRRPGLEIPLAVRLPPPRLARVALPRHALYFASWPGTVSPDSDGEDNWDSAGDGSGRLGIELVPRTILLRNAAFARVSGYLYRPNPGVVAVAIGLAALTLVLVRRPRRPAPEGR